MKVRILTADDVRTALPMSLAIDAMKLAFEQFSAGKAEVPLRTRLEIPELEGFTLFMPALLQESMDMAVKIVSVFPKNVDISTPTIHALVVDIDPRSGAPRGVLEGASLTAIRTGAASGAATDLLARQDAHKLALFGSGVQARTQLEAVCAVRDIAQVKLFSLDLPGAKRFCEDVAGSGTFTGSIEIADSPQEAIEDVDIICTATTSSTPVFPGEIVKPGTHVNAIGSFTPTMQELDADLLQRATIVVDSRSAVLAESGDLIIPIEAGRLSADDIHAELGEIIHGDRPGRDSDDQITVFKSVGLAVQDAIAAAAAMQGAREKGLGQIVDL